MNALPRAHSHIYKVGLPGRKCFPIMPPWSLPFNLQDTISSILSANFKNLLHFHSLEGKVSQSVFALS